jgi:hypothetical protein
MCNAVTFLNNVADLCVGRKNISQCHLDEKNVKRGRKRETNGNGNFFKRAK